MTILVKMNYSLTTPLDRLSSFTVIHSAKKALILLCLGVSVAFAQGTKSDYERADALPKLTCNKVFKAKVSPNWLPDNTRFWYRNDLAGGAREFVLVDVSKASRQPAFDHVKLTEALSKASGSPQKSGHLPFEAIDFTNDVDALLFGALGKHWKCDLATYEVSEIKEEKPEKKKNNGKSRRDDRQHSRSSAESPDKKRTAFVKQGNLHLRDAQSNEEFPLSDDADDEHFYETRFYWSPDSQKLLGMRTKRGTEHTVHFIESSPKDQVQPKLHSFQYLKPGDEIAQTKPRLFDVVARKAIPLDDTLFSNPWSVDEFRWQADSSRFTFLYNQRGHQVLRIVAVDAETGEAGALIDETSDTFVDYAFKQFTHYLDDFNEIIWMSERDGWNHLYLHDSRTGSVKNQITKGNWVVRGVDRVDEESRQVWFRAGGIYPEQDPYYIHYCRINFDGSGLVLLTSGNGTHAIEYSPNEKYLIDTYSRVDLPQITKLRLVADGALVCQLERAESSQLASIGWQTPERFVAKGRDGETDIYGVIFRPTTFDATKQYPVIEKIYAGPHGSFVPRKFSAYHSAQSLAELGFIVVQIDGMGTSHRSKAFHDVCWKNLGDSGLPDRVTWMKAAAEKYPYMDITRVGIFGGSAGGQSSTRAMLSHGDFYKVAVSDCGCHDNRMDKIWWNELWMGWPIGPHYDEQSNVTNAHKLQGKLLLIVGELDRNVDPASTMQVVDALIKADKDFDLLVVPGGGHGIAESPYGKRRRRDYFVRHLLGVEPRAIP